MIMNDLPDFVEMDNSLPGDYVVRFNEYLDRLYAIYKEDVAFGKLTFQGLKVQCQFRPESHGKHYAFWHVMQEGKPGSELEDDRNIDLDRCKRIQWIAWCIRNAGIDERIRVFPQNKRNGNQPWALWLYDNEYAVILWERNGYYLLKTAFMVKYKRAKEEFERDWKAWQKKTRAAASDDPENSVYTW